MTWMEVQIEPYRNPSMFAGEIWLCIEASCNVAAAKCISQNRGSGSTFSMDSAEKIQLCCSIFHGFTGDGAQLLHIVNLIGTPTKSDIDAMQLEGSCRVAIESIVAALPAAAHSAHSLNLCSFLAHRHIPVDIAHLLMRLLLWDPSQRLTAAHATWHPALQVMTRISATGELEGSGGEHRNSCRLPLSPVSAPLLTTIRSDDTSGSVGSCCSQGSGWLMTPLQLEATV